MLRRASSRIVVLIGVLTACDHAATGNVSTPSARVEDSIAPPPSPARVENDPLRDAQTPFTFRVIDFNWEVRGSTVLEIASDGSAHYTFYRGREEPVPAARRAEVGSATWIVTHWHRVELAIDAATVDELRRRLVADFRPLAPRYIDERVEDGAQTRYELDVAGNVQTVECVNEYPQPIRDLSTFLEERIFAPHRSAIDAAPEISLEEARQAGALR